MNPAAPEAIDSYELALKIISDFGAQITGDECAEIAWRGETGDMAYLLAWQEPEE